MNYPDRSICKTSYTAIALLGMLAVLSGLPAVVHAQSVSITTSRSSAFQLLLRGRERLQRKDYKGAFSDFNQAIILNPNDADNYVNRGFLLQQLGDQVSALSDFDRAVLINPRSAIAYFERGGTRYSLGDLTGGILDLQQAAKLFAQQGDRVNYQKAQNLIRQLRTPI
jgi:tetratricopeptide (TPR) repeat protein